MNRLPAPHAPILVMHPMRKKTPQMIGREGEDRNGSTLLGPVGHAEHLIDRAQQSRRGTRGTLSLEVGVPMSSERSVRAQLGGK